MIYSLREWKIFIEIVCKMRTVMLKVISNVYYCHISGHLAFFLGDQRLSFTFELITAPVHLRKPKTHDGWEMVVFYRMLFRGRDWENKLRKWPQMQCRTTITIAVFMQASLTCVSIILNIRGSNKGEDSADSGERTLLTHCERKHITFHKSLLYISEQISTLRCVEFGLSAFSLSFKSAICQKETSEFQKIGELIVIRCVMGNYLFIRAHNIDEFFFALGWINN